MSPCRIGSQTQGPETANGAGTGASPVCLRVLGVAALLAALALLAVAAPAEAQQYGFITKWGSPGSGNGQFHSPRGIATDAAGDVYVADLGNDRIQKFTSNGAFITKWGSEGSGDGEFGFPQGVATDAAGEVYVADYGDVGIQKFTLNGAFITKWGSPGRGDGEFDSPRGVATDAAGDVYVADDRNQRIQKFTSNGAFITKWGSRGSGNGEFGFPQGVATDAAGDVYVADTRNHRIQKFGTFFLGKVSLNRKRGIARLTVRVPDPGTVVLRRTKQVRRAARQFESAGRAALPVRPRGKAQRRISKHRCQRSGKKRLRVRVLARVTYWPTGSTSRTQQRRVRLVRRC
jgi:sugar lactone lactonase YvrE